MLAARGIARPGLWHESADRLRGAGEESGLWTQDLYGRVRQFLGPAHGFAGCVAALAHEADDELHRRASDVFKRFAIEETGSRTGPRSPTAALSSPMERFVSSGATVRPEWSRAWRRSHPATASTSACWSPGAS